MTLQIAPGRTTGNRTLIAIALMDPMTRLACTLLWIIPGLEEVFENESQAFPGLGADARHDGAGAAAAAAARHKRQKRDHGRYSVLHVRPLSLARTVAAESQARTSREGCQVARNGRQ